MIAKENTFNQTENTPTSQKWGFVVHSNGTGVLILVKVGVL